MHQTHYIYINTYVFTYACVCLLSVFVVCFYFFATTDQIKFYYCFKALRLSFLLLPHPVAAEIKHIHTCIRTNMCMHSHTYTYVHTHISYICNYIQLLISHSLTQYENALYLSLSVLLFLSIYTVSFKLFCKLRFVIRMLLCLFVCVFYCNENQSSLTSLSIPVSLPSCPPLPNRFSTFSLPNIQHCISVQFNCGFNCSLAIYTSLLRLSLTVSRSLSIGQDMQRYLYCTYVKQFVQRLLFFLFACTW